MIAEAEPRFSPVPCKLRRPELKVRAGQLEAHEPLSSADRYVRRLANFPYERLVTESPEERCPPDIAAHTTYFTALNECSHDHYTAQTHRPS